MNPRHSAALPSKAGSLENGGIRRWRVCLSPDSVDSLSDDSLEDTWLTLFLWCLLLFLSLFRLELCGLKSLEPLDFLRLCDLCLYLRPLSCRSPDSFDHSEDDDLWRWRWRLRLSLGSEVDDLLCARRSFSGDDDRCRDLRDFLSPCPFDALASDVLSVCFGRLSIPQPLPSFSIFRCRISWWDIRGPREVCAFRMPSSCDGSWTSWPLCSLCSFIFSGSMSRVPELLSSSTESSSSSLSTGSCDVKPGPVKKTSGRRR